MDIIAEARQVFKKEIIAVEKTKEYIGEDFEKIINLIRGCHGKIIVTGMGKPGHIGRKIAATFSSLGTKAFFLHPAEALHGDVGVISEEDVLLAISWSGESEEITRLLPTVKMHGIPIVGITSNSRSTLAKYSDILQILPSVEEADEWNLAPTASATCELVYGDALAVVLSKLCDFQKEDFGSNHPAGALGKRLCYRVADLMLTGEKHAVSYYEILLKDAIIEMSKKASPIVSLIDENRRLKGVITDGDLRRLLEKNVNIYTIEAQAVMTRHPTFVYEDEMAIEALETLSRNRYSAMPVLSEEGFVIGTITLQDILKQGILGKN